MVAPEGGSARAAAARAARDRVTSRLRRIRRAPRGLAACRHCATRGDRRLHYALGVAADAADHRRRERVQEMLTDEVEAAMRRRDAARVPRLAVGTDDRQIDP